MHATAFQIPAPIVAYNKYINRVDNFDQLSFTSPTKRQESKLEEKCCKEEQKFDNEVEQSKKSAKRQIIQTYGFVADPCRTATVNAVLQLIKLPSWL